MTTSPSERTGSGAGGEPDSSGGGDEEGWDDTTVVDSGMVVVADDGVEIGISDMDEMDAVVSVGCC